jgi:Tol biopolymer transport system component
LTSFDCGSSFFGLNPDWSPAGGRILYVKTRDSGAEQPPPSQVVVTHPDGSGRKVVVQSAGIQSLAWAPDPATLVWDFRSEPSSGGPSGIYVGPFGNPTERFIAQGSNPAWSPDGRLLALVEAASGFGRCSQIAIYDATTGSHVRDITEPVARDGDCYRVAVGPDWSPDGRRIVYGGSRSLPGDDARNYEIIVTGRYGRNPRRLTRNGVNDEGPVWSPDGRLLVYAHQVGHRQDLYVIRRDGSGNRRLVTNATQPSWQPRGGR